MGSVRWIVGAVLVLAAGCLAPDGAPAPDAGRACAEGGTSCPTLSGFTTTCEGGVCVARSPSGEALADCAGEGRYAADLLHDAHDGTG